MFLPFVPGEWEPGIGRRPEAVSVTKFAARIGRRRIEPNINQLNPLGICSCVAYQQFQSTIETRTHRGVGYPSCAHSAHYTYP